MCGCGGEEKVEGGNRGMEGVRGGGGGGGEEGAEREWRGGGRGVGGGGGGEWELPVLPSPTSSASIPPLKSGLLRSFVRN